MTADKTHRGHNEGSITERKNKAGDVVGYQAQVTVPGGGRRSATLKTEAAARRWIREMHAEAAAGRLLAKRPPTLAAYLSKTWLPAIKTRVKSRTRASYRLAAKRLPAWLGALRLDELKPAHFQRFYTELSDAGKAARTVRQTHMVLHKAMQDALPLGLVNRNPTDGASLPRIPQSEPHWYTDEQLAGLFAATAGTRFHALWVLLGTLGLRPGEALGLKWADVDWKAGTVRAVRTLDRNRETGTLELREMKTKHSRRTLPLSALAVDALRSHQDRQNFDRKRSKEAWQEHGLVFATIYGGPLEEARIHPHWTAACKAAGLPRYEPYALRHSVASNLMRAGCDVFRVGQLLGHRNANMVIQVYGHLRPDDHHSAAALMAGLIRRHDPAM